MEARWFEAYNQDGNDIRHHYLTCDLEPRVACVFFNSTCLATLPAGSRHVEEYFSTLVEDLTFTALATFFIDALVTFTLARFGGVPVPVSTRIGSVCWLLFVFIVFMQWLMVLLSLIMDVFVSEDVARWGTPLENRYDPGNKNLSINLFELFSRSRTEFIEMEKTRLRKKQADDHGEDDEMSAAEKQEKSDAIEDAAEKAFVSC